MILSKGPLFIVGASRSGTKLLRDVMNGHSQISIPTAESHFIPYLLTRFPSDCQTNASDLKKLVKVVMQSMFIQSMERKGVRVHQEEVVRCFVGQTLPEGVRRLMMFVAEQENGQPFTSEMYWGDKTPSYLMDVRLLKGWFPDACFLHIMRDPRDRALSANSAWGADLKLSVSQWQKMVSVGRKQGKEMTGSWSEVKYEDLVREPENVVANICSSLSLNFEERMLELKRPVEILGDAEEDSRRFTAITAKGVGRWSNALAPELASRLAELATPVAMEGGYVFEGSNEEPHHSITRKERFLSLPKDRWRTLSHHVKLWGFFKGIRHLFWRGRMAKKVRRARDL